MGELPEDIIAAKRLVQYGFYKGGDYDKDFDNRKAQLVKVKKDDVVKHSDMEKMELRSGKFVNTSYPKPIERHVLSMADPNYTSMEKAYTWIMGHISRDRGFTKLIKVADSFGSSPASDHWSIMIDRLGNMQRQVSNIMQTVGILVKDLFPMIHELRIWDERLTLHQEVNEKESKAADIALKGTWIDLVDGGPESGMSVLGLAQKANYLTLPDLFFGTFVISHTDVDKAVDNQPYAAEQVKNILKRKLKQYLIWKEKTYHEIVQNRKFSIHYLRQHINAIKLQMSWLQPYLKQLKYLKPNTKFQDQWDVVSSFDMSHYEVEVLCTMKDTKKFKPVILVNFQYATKPERVGAYQHSAVQHAGGMTVTFRTYAWDDDQIENYKKMRDSEAMDGLEDMDGGFQAAMESLGEEINKYMEQAGETIKAENRTMSEKMEALEKQLEIMESDPEAVKRVKAHKALKEPSMSLYEPFKDIGVALWDVFKMFLPFKDNMFKDTFDFKTKNKDFAQKNADSAMKKGAAKTASGVMKAAFVNFRKANKMITW